MKLTVSAEATKDLESISDWISKDNPVRARSFVRELLQSCSKILEYPHGHPIVGRFKADQVRRKVFGSYLIFYMIIEQTVEITHIMHGSRDYEAVIFPDE